jgi:thioredoxin 1
MAMSKVYEEIEPSRDDVDAMQGPAVVEFGAPGCGHCLAAQPLLESAFAGYPSVRHLKISDGKGRRLGRSFRVKLWPTLIFLRNGLEIERVVRPADAATIRDALAHIL